MHPKRVPDPLDVLTEREREVLAQLAEGRSNTAIAAALFIAERTVESHTTQIFQKLGLECSTMSIGASPPCLPTCGPCDLASDPGSWTPTVR